MTIDEAIKLYRSREAEYKELAGMYKEHEEFEMLQEDNRQLAEWLTEYKELKKSIGAVKLSNMKEALELIQAYKAENARLREFNDKIYDLLSDTFGCPCNFSPLDEYMLKNGGCDDCCGTIPDEECWSRYIQTKLIGGETE